VDGLISADGSMATASVASAAAATAKKPSTSTSAAAAMKQEDEKQYSIVVITGYRGFTDAKQFETKLSDIMNDHVPDVLLMGDEPNGTDALARQYAIAKGWSYRCFAASRRQAVEQPHTYVVSDWDVDGLSAGPKRNRIMLDYALRYGKTVSVLAFLSPLSKGTKQCIGLVRTHFPSFQLTIVSI
jgi:hypothetical protein